MMERLRRIPETRSYRRSFVGRVTRIRRCRWLSTQSDVKIKIVVAKARIKESGLKKLKLLN